VKGWLVDTNVIASLIASNGAPSVKNWALAVDERDLYISVLTLGEYDKGIANLSSGNSNTARYIEARDALQARFAGRILSLEDLNIRRWGSSGRLKRETGHAPPVIDTLLAATAIEKDLYLVSRKASDLANSGAAVFDPWRDKLAQFPLKARPRG
jgi:predicted nucleic acid-binding protein